MPGNSDIHGRSGTYLLVLPWDLEAVGGVNRVVIGLYEGVERYGTLDPRVLEITWDATSALDSVDAAGRRITKFRVRSPLGTGSWLRDVLRYLAMLPFEMRRIRAFVGRYDVRVVNCHYIGGADFGWIIARSLGVFRGKVLLSLHGLDIRTLAATRGVKRWLWGWALRRADAVVACSEGLADEVARDFRLPPGRVVTIHNGVDAEQIAAAVAGAGTAAPRAHADPVLLNLGTLEHKKGHDVLLRAFASVAARHPTARLQIMGRDGETKASTLSLIAELGLQDRVAVDTNVAHAVALRALGGADVFVLSSRNEAFSVALLEAAALGKPVVATNVCGVPELIRDGNTGVVVPSEDPEALARGILRLLDDRGFAAECGQRLQELVRTRFTLENTSRGYLDLAGYLAG